MRLCFIYCRDVFRATVLRNRQVFLGGSGAELLVRLRLRLTVGNKTELKTFLNVYFKAIEARMLKNLIIIVTTF